MQATVRMTECDSEAMIVKSLSVPIGLEQLMESLTKEVLLKRPSDIYSFAYNHFNRLLRLREKGCYKAQPPLRGVKTVIKRSTDTKNIVQKTNVSVEKRQSLSKHVNINTDSTDSLYLTGSNKKLILKKERQLLTHSSDNKNISKASFIEKRKVKRTVSLDDRKKEFIAKKEGRKLDELVEKKDTKLTRSRNYSVDENSVKKPEKLATGSPKILKRNQTTPGSFKIPISANADNKIAKQHGKISNDILGEQIDANNVNNNSTNENNKATEVLVGESGKEINDKTANDVSVAANNIKSEEVEERERSKRYVPKISSVEDSSAFVKDGKSGIEAPKIIKRTQTAPDSIKLPTSLAVPLGGNIASGKAAEGIKNQVEQYEHSRENNKKGSEQEEEDSKQVVDDAKAAASLDVNFEEERNEVKEEYQSNGEENQLSNTTADDSNEYSKEKENLNSKTEPMTEINVSEATAVFRDAKEQEKDKENTAPMSSEHVETISEILESNIDENSYNKKENTDSVTVVKKDISAGLKNTENKDKINQVLAVEEKFDSENKKENRDSANKVIIETERTEHEESVKHEAEEKKILETIEEVTTKSLVQTVEEKLDCTKHETISMHNIEENKNLQTVSKEESKEAEIVEKRENCTEREMISTNRRTEETETVNKEEYKEANDKVSSAIVEEKEDYTKYETIPKQKIEETEHLQPVSKENIIKKVNDKSSSSGIVEKNEDCTKRESISTQKTEETENLQTVSKEELIEVNDKNSSAIVEEKEDYTKQETIPKQKIEETEHLQPVSKENIIKEVNDKSNSSVIVEKKEDYTKHETISTHKTEETQNLQIVSKEELKGVNNKSSSAIVEEKEDYTKYDTISTYKTEKNQNLQAFSKEEFTEVKDKNASTIIEENEERLKHETIPKYETEETENLQTASKENIKKEVNNRSSSSVMVEESEDFTKQESTHETEETENLQPVSKENIIKEVNDKSSTSVIVEEKEDYTKYETISTHKTEQTENLQTISKEELKEVNNRSSSAIVKQKEDYTKPETIPTHKTEKPEHLQAVSNKNITKEVLSEDSLGLNETLLPETEKNACGAEKLNLEIQKQEQKTDTSILSKEKLEIIQNDVELIETTKEKETLDKEQAPEIKVSDEHDLPKEVESLEKVVDTRLEAANEFEDNMIELKNNVQKTGVQKYVVTELKEDMNKEEIVGNILNISEVADTNLKAENTKKEEKKEDYNKQLQEENNRDVVLDKIENVTVKNEVLVKDIEKYNGNTDRIKRNVTEEVINRIQENESNVETNDTIETFKQDIDKKGDEIFEEKEMKIKEELNKEAKEHLVRDIGTNKLYTEFIKEHEVKQVDNVSKENGTDVQQVLVLSEETATPEDNNNNDVEPETDIKNVIVELLNQERAHDVTNQKILSSLETSDSSKFNDKHENVENDIKTSNYDPLKLKQELKEVQEITKFNSFKTSYNPYVLRNEIRCASKDTEAPDDKVISDVFAENVQAIVKIQAFWRGYKTRKDIKAKTKVSQKVDGEDQGDKLLRDFADKVSTIVKIQAFWKGYKTRKDAKVKTKVDQEVASTKDDKDTVSIQNDKLLHDFADKVSAIVKIQAMWRGYLARKLVKKIMKDLRTSSLAEEFDKLSSNFADKVWAVVKIQAFWRGYKARKCIKREEEIKISTENKQHVLKLLQADEKSYSFADKATIIAKIQALWRGYKARKQYKAEKVKKTIEKHELAKRIAAVLKIQSLWRGYKVRKASKINNKETVEGPVLHIDSKIPKEPTVFENDFKKQVEAVLLIQKVWRGFLARKIVGFKLQERKNHLEIKQDDKEVDIHKENSQNNKENAETEEDSTQVKDTKDTETKTEAISKKTVFSEATGDSDNAKIDTIPEEEYKKEFSTSNVENEPSESSKKLSDTEIQQALSVLDDISVPTHSPINDRKKRDTTKQNFARSTTVEEPEISKKNAYQLTKSYSADNTKLHLLNNLKENASNFVTSETISEQKQEINKDIKIENEGSLQTSLEKEVKTLTTKISDSLNDSSFLTKNYENINQNKEIDINKTYDSKLNVQDDLNKSTTNFDITKLRSEIQEASKDFKKEDTDAKTKNMMQDSYKHNENKLTSLEEENVCEEENKKYDANQQIQTVKDFIAYEQSSAGLINELVPQSNIYSAQESVDKRLEVEVDENLQSLDTENETKQHFSRPLSIGSTTSVDSAVTVIYNNTYPTVETKELVEGSRVAVEETKNETAQEILKDMDTEESKNTAATKIQSTYRGHLVRKGLKTTKIEQENSSSVMEAEERLDQETEPWTDRETKELETPSAPDNVSSSVDVDPSQSSAGAPLLTSRRFDRTPSPSAASDVNAGAHARLKDARETERVGQPTPTDVCGACDNMEEKRINASIVGKNKTVEAEAATKIQASFRGYQVRKQLKTKNGGSDIGAPRRAPRRKSSGRIMDANNSPQTKTKPTDLENRSAAKIQAGVRGFLVRKRVQKAKKPIAQAS